MRRRAGVEGVVLSFGRELRASLLNQLECLGSLSRDVVELSTEALSLESCLPRRAPVLRILARRGASRRWRPMRR